VFVDWSATIAYYAKKKLPLLIEIGIYFQSNACQIFFWNIMAAAILVHWNLEIVLSANLEIKIKGLII